MFEKVGSSEPQRVDVRIIAATNKDIERAVQEGKFRRDLYYRLNVLPLYIPPLRERTDDIMELAEFFLKKFKRETKKEIQGFSDESINALLSYHWPGNVRELENVVERSVVICSDTYIRPEHLILRYSENNKLDVYHEKTLKDAVNLFKKMYITKTLREHDWKQNKTAEILDIQRTYLSRLVKELNISK